MRLWAGRYVSTFVCWVFVQLIKVAIAAWRIGSANGNDKSARKEGGEKLHSAIYP
jgi:hypothetical protein